jgi:hypothetical protein
LGDEDLVLNGGRGEEERGEKLFLSFGNVSKLSASARTIEKSII